MAKLLETVKNYVHHTQPGTRKALVERDIADNIDYYRMESEDVIKQRLAYLDEEWDIERALELNASLAVLAGLVFSATISKKRLWLPAAITGLFAAHAVKRFNMPIPTCSRVRTRAEIARERYGLQELLKNREFRQLAS